MAEEVQAIAVAVVQWNDQFLIGPRPAGRPLAGYWEFPGGRLLPGESPADAAVRECREETGLLVRAIGAYPDALHAYAHGTVRLHFIACQPAHPPSWLRAPFRWVARTQLVQYVFPPANTALLKTLSSGG